MDKQATIETLQRLSSLISAREELDNLDAYEIDDQTSQTITNISNKYFDWKGIPYPELVSKAYCFELIKDEKKPKSSSSGTYIYAILAYVCITITFLPQIIGWIGWFIGLGAITLLVLSLKTIDIIGRNKVKKQKNTKEYEPVQSAFQSYEEQTQQCVQKLEERRALLPNAFAECLQEIEAAEKKKTEIRERINECNKEIKAINMITPKHYHLIDQIVDLLETGCADTYKEALNMAITQEKELKHRQGIENSRRQEQEYIAEQKRLALKQCKHCYYSGVCDHEGTTNCTRFRPLL